MNGEKLCKSVYIIGKKGTNNNFNFERKIHLFFRKCVYKFKAFCPEVGVGRGAGTFIYALSVDETSTALAAPRYAITALF